MEILADYHTHTIFSHGLGTIEENIKEAISKGIKTIGISDHGYKHMSYGVKREKIFVMREEVDRLKDKYTNINILLGIECNILDNSGNIDMDDKVSNILDYIMAGYHFASTPTSIKSIFNHGDNYFRKSIKAKEYNTQSLIKAMKNNDIFIITHPGDKGDVYIEEVAKVAKETNTSLEINSSHGYLNIDQINKIKNIGNSFIIGSDAHIPSNVGNFQLAIDIVNKSKLDTKLIKNIRL